MRTAFTIMALLVVSASGVAAADPIYIDQLMEMPLAALQQQFPKLRNEGCYQIAPDRYLWIEIEKKDRKPWRVAITSVAPCKRPAEGPALDIRDRQGVDLGVRTREVLDKMGRPDASAPPEADFKKLGETEYVYMCRVSEGCARHTSVFMRDGYVTAISSWYSE